MQHETLKIYTKQLKKQDNMKTNILIGGVQDKIA